MIKFFRKIRKTLLSEGKTGKYFKYAIGEIILVVIGILIALQINTWNEERGSKNLERQLLSEMHNELEVDYSHFKKKIANSRTKLEATQSLIKVIDQKIPYHDSLNVTFSKVVIYTSFFPSTSTHETITNTGISILSNDTLRLKIQQLYNTTYKFVVSVDEWRADFYFSEIASFNIDYFKEFSWWDPSIPIDGPSLLNDTRYYNILKTEKVMATQEIHVYQDAIKKVDELMDLIHSEINE